jgi:dihydroxyacetone kinase-like protein
MNSLVDASEEFRQAWLAGFLATHRNLLVGDPLKGYVRRRHLDPGKVSVVSGGGAGHEPLHLGFVGKGMLSAACVGRVFTSPTPDVILDAIRASPSEKGTLLIVKQYAGDVLNFEIAAERAPGPCRMLFVNDDVSGGEEADQRRGIAGTVLVEKLLGAAAERGASLDELVGLGTEILARTASIGITTAACTNPFTGKRNFELGAAEYEFGVGIHGELGRERRTGRTLQDICRHVVDMLLSADMVSRTAPLLLLINNLGSMSDQELYAVATICLDLLAKKKLKVEQLLVGRYVTALDTVGFSVTLCAMTATLGELWKDAVVTAALR